jgi:Dienelactone hydrolase family
MVDRRCEEDEGMTGWMLLALMGAALGGALSTGLPAARRERVFAEWREAPPEPAGGLASLPPLLQDGAGRPIPTRMAWARRRKALWQEWTALMGPFPRRVALKPEVVATEELPDHTRLLVRYRSEAKVTNEAYLLLPRDGRGKHQGMVVLHQTSDNTIAEPVGLTGREPMQIALQLVRRGYVCVAPRCFLWGYGQSDSLGDATHRLLATPPWKTGMAKMTWDGIRAVDYLRTRPEVDPARIGCIGHSLGGKTALYLGAFDERIQATVSCEGGVGLSFSNWDAPWYLGPRIREPGFPRDNHELIALIAPRPFLLIGGGSADGPQSWPYVAAALPIYRLFGAEEHLGLQLTRDGHDFPHAGPDREKTYAWLDHWLQHRP